MSTTNTTNVDAQLFQKLLEQEEKRKEYRRMYNQRTSVKQKQSEYHKERNQKIQEQSRKFQELVESGVIDEDGNIL